MSSGPDITLAAGPLLKVGWWFIPVGVGLWGCCAAHRRQASSYTDRAAPG